MKRAYLLARKNRDALGGAEGFFGIAGVLPSLFQKLAEQSIDDLSDPCEPGDSR